MYPSLAHIQVNQLLSVLNNNIILPENEYNFLVELYYDIFNGKKYNITQLEKIAQKHNIVRLRKVKELVELSYLLNYRRISLSDFNDDEKFEKILNIYNNQTNLYFGDQDTFLLQQYSTPAPISFLMGKWCSDTKVNNKSEFYLDVLEPSAGNGLLSLYFNPKQVTVNELDSFRLSSLKIQDFHKILNVDATNKLPLNYKFDVVMSNPPFGSSDNGIKDGNFLLIGLEQIMIYQALTLLKEDGTAAFIIGGHTKYDEKGRLQAGKNRSFFSWLISRYNVVDVINVDGKMYSRQGTTFPIRIILINGIQKEEKKYFPLENKNLSEIDFFSPKIISNFEQLKLRLYANRY